VERFSLKRLNEIEVRKQYFVKILDIFTALGNLDDDVDVNKAWEAIRI
jgi:hypothetical protein